jgi:hypothetical protein
MQTRFYVLILIGLLFFGGESIAQQTEPTGIVVPDVTGMTLPHAIERLNQLEINFGREIQLEWTAESGIERDVVRVQSTTAGEMVEAATVVNLTVPRRFNAELVYDNNDITLRNLGEVPLPLNSLWFTGADQVFFALRWGQTLGAGECVQLWSVNRNAPKRVSGCPGDYARWFTSNDARDHFWTPANDSVFRIIQNGLERTRCDPASTGGEVLRCRFYMSTSDAPEYTDHVYMLYTPDTLLVLNNGEDYLMSLVTMRLEGENETVLPLIPGIDVYDTRPTIGRVNVLAPGQCVYVTKASGVGTAVPEPCQLLGRASLEDETVPWEDVFIVQSSISPNATRCPAPIEGQRTLCIAPR